MNMKSKEYQRLKQIVKENEGISVGDAALELHRKRDVQTSK